MSAYATIDEADAYFTRRLYSEPFTSVSDSDKTKALDQATRIIDRLNFAGVKHSVHVALGGRYIEDLCQSELHSILKSGDETQPLKCPRGADEEVSEDIKIACFEIAFSLLDGVDAEAERNDKNVVSQGYSSVRTTYDRSVSLEHFNAGVPSATAWGYLKPYLRSGSDVKISRV